MEQAKRDRRGRRREAERSRRQELYYRAMQRGDTYAYDTDGRRITSDYGDLCDCRRCDERVRVRAERRAREGGAASGEDAEPAEDFQAADRADRHGTETVPGLELDDLARRLDEIMMARTRAMPSYWNDYHIMVTPSAGPHRIT